jgi:hypothetical protein
MTGFEAKMTVSGITRIAFTCTVMPAPSGSSAVARSKMRTANPRCFKAMPAVRPPIPAPQIAIDVAIDRGLTRAAASRGSCKSSYADSLASFLMRWMWPRPGTFTSCCECRGRWVLDGGAYQERGG